MEVKEKDTKKPDIKVEKETTEPIPDKAEKETAEPIPDKVEKPETIDTDSKTEKTESTGEYSDARKDVMDHMKSYYGEGTTIDDSNYASKMEEMVSKDYGPTKERNSKFESANKNLQAFMHENPELGGVISDVGKGANAGQVLNKYFDLKALVDSKGGDEKSYAENEKARTKKYDDYQSHMSNMKSNEEESYKVIEEFMKEMKLEGENADVFGKWIADAIDNANMGKITKDFLTRMFHAMNYDKDVSDASKKGEIKAKNKAIKETMKTEKDLKKGDGLVSLQSAAPDVDKNTGSGDEFADYLEKGFKKRGKRTF